MAVERREATDEELVAWAQAERSAFIELYRRYADAIYRYCFRRSSSREIAEDWTAQTFLKALTHLPTYRAGSFRAWLFRIAHNVVTDGYRTRRDHAPLNHAHEIQAMDHGPESLVLLDETRRELQAALTGLPIDQRDVVELRLAGLSAAEIAETLGRSIPSVKSAQYRAFARLRRSLADLNPGEPR